MRKALVAVLALVVVFVVGAIGTQAQTTPSGTEIKRTVLMKVENLKGCPGMDGYITVTEIPPSMTTGMHTHPGQEFGYWLEGEGVWGLKGEPQIAAKAGDTDHIDPMVIHYGTNTGTKPLKIVVFLVVEHGKPIAAPAQ
jgi:quercetin dioxygenase-like cupin family protein